MSNMTVVILSTSAWIITSKAEEQVKSVVYVSNKDKESQAVVISEVTKQTILITEVDEEELIAKQKIDARAIKKAKQDELVKKAEAKKLAKISLGKNNKRKR